MTAMPRRERPIPPRIATVVSKDFPDFGVSLERGMQLLC
jgi:hypothetical protein